MNKYIRALRRAVDCAPTELQAAAQLYADGVEAAEAVLEGGTKIRAEFNQAVAAAADATTMTQYATRYVAALQSHDERKLQLRVRYIELHRQACWQFLDARAPLSPAQDQPLRDTMDRYYRSLNNVLEEIKDTLLKLRERIYSQLAAATTEHQVAEIEQSLHDAYDGILKEKEKASDIAVEGMFTARAGIAPGDAYFTKLVEAYRQSPDLDN